MNHSLKNSLRQDIHSKVFYFALILIAVTLPYSLLANSISIIILLINWIAEGNYAEKVKSVKRNFLLLLFLLFYVLHLIGMLYTHNTNDGAFELQKKFSLFIIPLIVATSSQLSMIQVKSILIFFIISILVASSICLGYAFYRNIIDPSPVTDWLYFSNRDLTEIIKIQPTYLALYVCFSIFILLNFLINDFAHGTTVKKAILIFLILYLICFLFLVASRTAIAALVGISFLGIIYYFYKINNLLKGFFVILSISIVLIAIMYQMPVIRERFMLVLGIEHKDVWINQYGDGKGAIPDVRPLKWKCAINVIKQNWLIGVGTGDVQDQLQIQYKNIGFNAAYQQEFNAHNQFLETWLGLGLVGLFSFFICLIVPSLLAFRRKKYLYLSFLILILISCITESMLCRQQGIVFYSFFTSIFAFHCLGNK